MSVSQTSAVFWEEKIFSFSDDGLSLFPCPADAEKRKFSTCGRCCVENLPGTKKRSFLKTERSADGSYMRLQFDFAVQRQIRAVVDGLSALGYRGRGAWVARAVRKFTGRSAGAGRVFPVFAGRARAARAVTAAASCGAAALAAFEDAAYMRTYVKEVCRARERFVTEMNREPVSRHFKAFPSRGNFVLVRCDSEKTKAAILAWYESRDIYVRNVSQSESLKDCVRVSIGTIEQTEKVIEATKLAIECGIL